MPLPRMVNISPRFSRLVATTHTTKTRRFGAALHLIEGRKSICDLRAACVNHSTRRSVSWRPFLSPMNMGNGGGKGDAEAVAQVKSRIEELITTNKVVIFAKGYCPYCHIAKDAFKDIGYTDFLWIELGEEKNGSLMQSILGQMTGASSVPRVFIDGKCIGGGDDTVALKKSGQLQQLVAA